MKRRSRSRHGIPNEEQVRQRAAKLELVLGIHSRLVAEKMAINPEAEWVFGRMFLFGLINQEQYDMALRIDHILTRYRNMISPYTKVKAWKPDALRGVVHVKLTKDEEKKMIELREEYEKIYGILRQCGKDTVLTFFTALDSDTMPELICVQTALDAMIIGVQMA